MARPVRSYPPLPALLGHTATPTNPQPTGYEQALHWDYAFIYQHQSLAVDQVSLEVEFNTGATPRDLFNSPTDDLFATLAQYNTVAAGLWDFLKNLPDTASGGVDPAVENAVATFGSLAAAVAAKWRQHWEPVPSHQVTAQSSGEGPVPEGYRFTQTLESAADATGNGRHYTTLTLRREPMSGVAWPIMGVVLADGTVCSMGPGTDSPDGRVYPFPDGIVAFGLLGLEMRFSGLHIASYQTASAAVSVSRNAVLSDDLPTRSSFVFRTRAMAFPNPIVPLLSWNNPFDIGTWTDDAPTNPLDNVFTNMFDGSTGNRKISCAIRYGYELAGSGADAMVPYLPVRYRPMFSFHAEDPTPSGTVTQIISAVNTWSEYERPATVGGRWLLRLSLFSSADGHPDRPLLELPVYSPISE